MKSKAFILLLLLAFTSCKKDKGPVEPLPVAPPDNGSVKVSFKGMAESADLVYHTNYTNLNGDTFQVNMFKYYISNVILTRQDGSKYYEAESYHLIDHDVLGKKSFTLVNVPSGTYKSMSYIIGVDSLHNVSGAQEGDLSPSHGMYWPWLGYNMLKFEGTSPQAASIDKTLVFHIGGYSGSTNAIQSRTINFSQDLVVANHKSPEIKLKTNVCELFKNPNTYDFPSTYDITSPGIRSNGFAANYADMISFDAIIP